jgi:hypothetical protein
MRVVYFILGVLFFIAAATTIRLSEFTYAPANWLRFALAVAAIVFMSLAQRIRR